MGAVTTPSAVGCQVAPTSAEPSYGTLLRRGHGHPGCAVLLLLFGLAFRSGGSTCATRAPYWRWCATDHQSCCARSGEYWLFHAAHRFQFVLDIGCSWAGSTERRPVVLRLSSRVGLGDGRLNVAHYKPAALWPPARYEHGPVPPGTVAMVAVTNGDRPTEPALKSPRGAELLAVLRHCREHGYDRNSGCRCGVAPARAAVYRRWPSKAEVVLAALHRASASRGPAQYRRLARRLAATGS